MVEGKEEQERREEGGGGVFWERKRGVGEGG